MKIINLVLGLGAAIILASLVGLGIETFYPGPQYPDYPEEKELRSGPQTQCEFNCNFDDSECFDRQDACYDELEHQFTQQDDEYQKQLDQYEKDVAAYGRNYFMIANLIGLLIFLGGNFLLFFAPSAARSVAVGVMASGLIAIIESYAASWFSGFLVGLSGPLGISAEPSQGLQFFVGLLVAVIVIVVSMWSLHRYQQRYAQSGGPTQP